MKRWMLAIVAIVLVLGGCSQNNKEQASKAEGNTNQSKNEPIEIEFWHAMSGERDAVLTEIVNRFNEQSETITVKAINQGNGSYPELEKKLMAAAKAKQLPAVSQVTSAIVPEFTKNQFVEPLNAYIENADFDEEDIIQVFREASQWSGTYYTLPFSKSVRILFYNKGLLEEHGFEAPKTWDEVREIAKVVTGDGVIGMGFENDFYLEYESLMKQMGGTLINEEEGRAEFNSEAGIQALTYIKGLIDEEIARFPGEDGFLSGPFARGDVAMYITSSPGVTHIRPLAEEIEWSTAVIPSYNGNAATAFFGNEIAMFNQLTEDEKKATWEFMAYLMSTEVTTEWATRTGYLPARYSAIESDSYKKFLEENPEFTPAIEQFDIAYMSARIPGTKAVQNILLEEIDEAILNRKSVEEAIKQAQDRANVELTK